MNKKGNDMVLKIKRKTKEAKQEVFKSSNMDTVKIPEIYKAGDTEVF